MRRINSVRVTELRCSVVAASIDRCMVVPKMIAMMSSAATASGGVRDNERDPRLPWNAGKTGNHGRCDGDECHLR